MAVGRMCSNRKEAAASDLDERLVCVRNGSFREKQRSKSQSSSHQLINGDKNYNPSLRCWRRFGDKVAAPIHSL